jgi:hypothetical protein
MQTYYVVSNFDGGLCTIRFNGYEGVPMFEDQSLAMAYMDRVASDQNITAAITELAVEGQREAVEILSNVLSEDESERVVFLFPDAEIFWQLMRQIL